MNHTPHELQQKLQELAVESENPDLKVNKSKTKAMIENDTQIYIGRERLPETAPKPKTKTRRFKQEPWPAAQISPSTATSSRVIWEHV